MKVVRQYTLKIYTQGELSDEELRGLEAEIDEYIGRECSPSTGESWTTLENDKPEIVSAAGVGVDFGVEEET